MQLRFKTAVLCAAAVVFFAASHPASANSSETYPGIIANAPATALRAQLIASGSGLTRSLTIQEFSARSGIPVRSYVIDMQRRMHLIVVSDDLATFMHLHPVLDAAGTFRIVETFPKPGLYHLYADAQAAGFPHAVFRFDVPIEAQPNGGVRPALTRDAVAVVAPYTVRLSTTAFKSGADTPLLISIMKDGEPASDLHPYLGAYAHIVAIGASDLSYTHVHAMDASAMANGMAMDDAPSLPASAMVPATMDVHVTLPHPGPYKVWVQFMGGSRLEVASFVISAS